MIESNERTAVLICDASSRISKKSLATSLSSGLQVREIDIIKDGLTPSQIKDLANGFDVETIELANPGHPDYEKMLAGKDFGEEDLLQLLCRNPQLLKTPIVIHGDQYYFVNDSNELIKYLPSEA